MRYLFPVSLLRPVPLGQSRSEVHAGYPTLTAYFGPRQPLDRLSSVMYTTLMSDLRALPTSDPTRCHMGTLDLIATVRHGASHDVRHGGKDAGARR